MDPVSVGLFIVVGIGFVFAGWELRDFRRRMLALEKAYPELVAAEVAAVISSEKRVAAVELENRTIKADIAEIKAVRRAETAPPRQSKPGSWQKFQNETSGWEIDPK